VECPLFLARSSTSNRRAPGDRSHLGVKSKHKHCGSTAEFDLDIAFGVQPATGRTSRFERSGPGDRKHSLTGQLEARWNAALQRAEELERALKDIESTPRPASIPNREVLVSLAQDPPVVWNRSSDMGLKQRIARILIEVIVANIDKGTNEVVLVVHWAGGRHTEIRVQRPKSGEGSGSVGPSSTTGSCWLTSEIPVLWLLYFAARLTPKSSYFRKEWTARCQRARPDFKPSVQKPQDQPHLQSRLQALFIPLPVDSGDAIASIRDLNCFIGGDRKEPLSVQSRVQRLGGNPLFTHISLDGTATRA
jgi:hypothetical protein